MRVRVARSRWLAAVVVLGMGAVGAACAPDASVEVLGAHPVETTDTTEPPDTTSPPITDEPTTTTADEPEPTPPTEPPVDERVTTYEEDMQAAGESRPGGPAPRDPTLDAAAAAQAARISGDGDITDANSQQFYAEAGEAGTYVDFLASSDLWGGGGGTGGTPETEDQSDFAVEGLPETWGSSPDLLAYGIGGDGTTAVLAVRFAPFSESTVAAASEAFDRWVASLASTGALPAATHDPSLDAQVVHYLDDPFDPTIPSTLGGTVAFSQDALSASLQDVAVHPVVAYASVNDFAPWSALRHPNAERYGLRWQIQDPQHWALDLLVVGPAPTAEQVAAVQDGARSGALGDVNAVRTERGLNEVGWDPESQAEAERIAGILAERGTIEETVRTEWEAWFWEDVLLPGAPYVARDDVMEAVGGLGATPALGFALAQGSNGLFYYVLAGRVG